jgi:hypothetical protein
MNRIYHIFCGLLILLLLVAGCISLFDRDATVSEIQQRELKTFPKFTVAGFLNGSFLEDLEMYYADTFPGREALLKGDRIVTGLFDFSDLTFEETE